MTGNVAAVAFILCAAWTSGTKAKPDVQGDVQGGLRRAEIRAMADAEESIVSSPKELGSGDLDRAEGRSFADSVEEFGAAVFESLEGFDFGSPDGCVTDAEGNLDCTPHDAILGGNDMV
ncbi:hypothetical protein V5799_002585 [Amblyomma americanum]|uniref:Secreted protein n=1 Tax=Amblyomma americanum TaxID=6943 RepID=A0AAQ4CWX6_AMBAM